MINKLLTVPPLKHWLMALLAIFLGACVSLPENTDREPSMAYTDTANTTLGVAVADDIVAHPDRSGFFLLPGGLDAFAARGLLAYAAERSIDAQYYLFHDDLVGLLFVDTLLKAADRGVRVRLLIDDMALNDDKDLGMAALDAHPKIEIRVFNPFARKSSRVWQIMTRFDDVTRRMHNKSFTVDNQMTVVGGRNIGNEYFEADPDLAFGDLDVIGVGPVVKEVSVSFDLYWNSDVSYPIAVLRGEAATTDDLMRMRAKLGEYVNAQQTSDYTQALRNSDLVQRIESDRLPFVWGEATVLYDDPAKVTSARDQTDLHLMTQLRTVGKEVDRELIIFSPYFIPGREGVERLTALAERGVRVRILTNSLASTDVSVVHSGYAKYRPYLLRAGIEVWEVDQTLTREERSEKKGVSGSSKASLHAKSFVIDREHVFIGSMNLDPRSVVENTEIGIMIQAPDIAGPMADWFDDNIEAKAFRLALETDDNGNEKLVWYRQVDGGEERFTTEPNTGFWRRFGVGFMSLLPIESLL